MQINFSENDLNLLKKVSIIQNSVEIKKEITAKNQNGSTCVFSKLENFPENVNFSIFRLNEFIKLIEMYKKGDEYNFEFDENKELIIFNNGFIKTKYLTCSKEFIQNDVNKPVVDFEFSFEISKDQMLKLLKLEKILGFDAFYISSDNEGLKIGGVNSTTDVKSSILIDESIKDNFNNEISEYYKIPSDDYRVEYNKEGLIKFSSLNEDIIFYSTTTESYDSDDYEDIE